MAPRAPYCARLLRSPCSWLMDASDRVSFFVLPFFFRCCCGLSLRCCCQTQLTFFVCYVLFLCSVIAGKSTLLVVLIVFLTRVLDVVDRQCKIKIMIAALTNVAGTRAITHVHRPLEFAN